jgi:hypothetical protein
MKRSITWGLASLLWLAGLEGALQLQRLPSALFGGHDICGPWGCGPPVPVLLACHGFWLVLIGPPAVLAVQQLTNKWIWRLGIGLASAGLCGVIVVAVWEAATWLPEASAWQRQYVGQRFMFALVSFVDAPILQSLLIGTGLCLASRIGTVRSLGRSSFVEDGSRSFTDSRPEL